MGFTDLSPEQMDAAVVRDTNRILSAAAGVYGGMEVRHVKSGDHYVVICEALIEATMTKAIVYRSVTDSVTWVRPATEFCDGRFVGI